MNPVWQEILQQAGARLAGDEVLDFGDHAGELSAACSAAALVPLTHLGLVLAAGEDVQIFLHSLLTSDVKRLGSAAAQWSGMCSPKGRLLASFLMWRDEAGYLLQLAAELQPAIQKKLAMYVLRSKVKVSSASEALCLLGLVGQKAEAALHDAGLPLPQEDMSLARADALTVIRLAPTRYELALPAAGAGALWRSLAGLARPAGTSVWRWSEIVAGVPQITAGTQEEFVPQMANFELIGGVSFQKGCYPGQEIVARTQYLGKLKRRMYLAHLEGDSAPAAGEPLYSPELPDQSCGLVVSAAPAPDGGHDLLAVVQMSSAEAADVHLGRADGPRLTFHPLPYAVS